MGGVQSACASWLVSITVGNVRRRDACLRAVRLNDLVLVTLVLDDVAEVVLSVGLPKQDHDCAEMRRWVG